MTTAYICKTCGTQFAPSAAPPSACPICEDERQYVPPGGQGWTSLPELQHSHMATFGDDGGVLGIGSSPSFAIGQRALLVRTPAGNVLWDCISFIDETVVELIRGIGGIAAIAISHPHYYSTMLEWSRAFGGVPVYLHAADREWVMRAGPGIEWWEGETKEIGRGMTLIRAGGHFEGGTVLHWADGAGGKGAIFGGDILQVVADRKHVSFMRSFPNYIPLGAAAVRKIARIMEPWRFDAVYGAFWNRVIVQGGKQAVMASAERHIAWLEREAI